MKESRRKNIKANMKKCVYCLATENLTIDHKVPKSQGGKDDIKNLQCLCMRCNGIKSSLSHNQVRYIARWIYQVNKKRAEKGKRPLGVRNKELKELPPLG